MKITLGWLEEKNACSEGVEWFKNQKKRKSVKVLRALIKDNKLDWANWTIVRVMKRPQYLAYAIFAAEQVLDIFEKKYPDDKRPREAIEAAKKCLNDDSIENKKSAYVAYAAYVAAYTSAFSAAFAAAAAADAYAADAYADAAYVAASYAAFAAYADAYAAAAAAFAAADSAAAASGAKKKMKLKILEYGMSLLEEEK